MKKVKLGDYLKWLDRLAKIIGTTDEATVFIEMIDNKKCPHCGADLGKDQFSVIINSPLFQENAEKIQTINE